MENSSDNRSLYKLVYDWARYANDDLGKSIEKKRIGKTLALFNSRKFNVIGTGSLPDKVAFDFLLRGKFVDMGVGRGQKLGDVKGNQAIYSATGVKGRKPKKWFSKVLFPEANTLTKLLADQYGIISQNIIKENIDSTIKMSL